MRGEEAGSVLMHVCTMDTAAAETAIPPQYCSVRVLPPDGSGEDILLFKVVLLIQAFGQHEAGV